LYESVLRIGFERIEEMPLKPLDSLAMEDAAPGSLTVAVFT
jgi:hypothetical protein